jgi:hypothetical protein
VKVNFTRKNPSSYGVSAVRRFSCIESPNWMDNIPGPWIIPVRSKMSSSFVFILIPSGGLLRRVLISFKTRRMEAGLESIGYVNSSRQVTMRDNVRDTRDVTVRGKITVRMVVFREGCRSREAAFRT